MMNENRHGAEGSGVAGSPFDCNGVHGKSSSELLDEIIMMMDDEAEDEIDAGAIEEMLAVLQERAPVSMDHTPAEFLEALSEKHPLLFEVSKGGDPAEPETRKSGQALAQNPDANHARKGSHEQNEAPESRIQRQNPVKERSGVNQKQKRNVRSGIFRKIGLIAAAIAVSFACMVAAQASGLDVFGALARWTDETFRFETNNSHFAEETTATILRNEAYDTIQTEVDKLSISTTVVPTWFPDGFTLQDIQINANDTVQAIDCCFTNDREEKLFFSVYKYLENNTIDNRIFEKDDSKVIEYIGSKKLFYIISNLKNNAALWSNGKICIEINGRASKNELIKMIDSIGG